mmetsp:Transcript_45887/g.33647  ORF Transcript_45887/g.33647 Transcript_45887/m.33647 type:complete len:109 (-) Transcript_45887:677-1003(-)
MQLMHQCGIVHCDLKPENVLFTSKKCEKVKIVDFGSCCRWEENYYTYIQSRSYRAPEVILRYEKYDGKIDVWSLGCIVSELYTGKILFPGVDEHNQLELIMEVTGLPS